LPWDGNHPQIFIFDIPLSASSQEGLEAAMILRNILMAGRLRRMLGQAI
jgi:hypothetical protein